VEEDVGKGYEKKKKGNRKENRKKKTRSILLP